MGDKQQHPPGHQFDPARDPDTDNQTETPTGNSHSWHALHRVYRVIVTVRQQFADRFSCCIAHRRHGKAI